MRVRVLLCGFLLGLSTLAWAAAPSSRATPPVPKSGVCASELTAETSILRRLPREVIDPLVQVELELLGVHEGKGRLGAFSESAAEEIKLMGILPKEVRTQLFSSVVEQTLDSIRKTRFERAPEIADAREFANEIPPQTSTGRQRVRRKLRGLVYEPETPHPLRRRYNLDAYAERWGVVATVNSLDPEVEEARTLAQVSAQIAHRYAKRPDLVKAALTESMRLGDLIRNVPRVLFLRDNDFTYNYAMLMLTNYAFAFTHFAREMRFADLYFKPNGLAKPAFLAGPEDYLTVAIYMLSKVQGGRAEQARNVLFGVGLDLMRSPTEITSPREKFARHSLAMRAFTASQSYGRYHEFARDLIDRTPPLAGADHTDVLAFVRSLPGSKKAEAAHGYARRLTPICKEDMDAYPTLIEFLSEVGDADRPARIQALDAMREFKRPLNDRDFEFLAHGYAALDKRDSVLEIRALLLQARSAATCTRPRAPETRAIEKAGYLVLEEDITRTLPKTVTRDEDLRRSRNAGRFYLNKNDFAPAEDAFTRGLDRKGLIDLAVKQMDLGQWLEARRILFKAALIDGPPDQRPAVAALPAPQAVP